MRKQLELPYKLYEGLYTGKQRLLASDCEAKGGVGGVSRHANLIMDGIITLLTQQMSAKTWLDWPIQYTYFAYTKKSLLNCDKIPLVYTTLMNSAFRAIWLVPQSRNIKCIHLLAASKGKTWLASLILSKKYSNYLGIAINVCLYILKQLFVSVSVNSGGYLPRRSGSVNIRRYSPPLRWIIVISIYNTSE